MERYIYKLKTRYTLRKILETMLYDQLQFNSYRKKKCKLRTPWNYFSVNNIIFTMTDVAD